jgi:hypothetical protein
LTLAVVRDLREARAPAGLFVTWTATATGLPIVWDDALRRLEKPDTVHGRQ